MTWRVWVPAVALVAVALTQIALTRTAALSPWKGGGFGMFSTIDSTSFRQVRVFVTAPDRSAEVLIAPSLEDTAAQAALFPSRTRLEDLAKGVAARESRHGHPVDFVRIEVWSTQFAGDPLTGTLRRLRTFEFAVGADES
jgi:hypothetical protein